MGSKPPKKNKKKAAARGRGPTPPRPAPVGDHHDRLILDWVGSRAGGRAGRGYHFQDAVGAYLGARIAAGSLVGDLVAEGFDDMSVEGPTGGQCQVKSRVEHRGPFPSATAAEHLVTAWQAAAARSETAGTVIVVLERGVDTAEDLTGPTALLSDVLAANSPLHTALYRTAGRLGLGPDRVDELLGRTVLLGLSWDDVDDRIDDLLAGIVAVPPAARAALRRVLYAAVAAAADANGSASYDQRVRLTRTELVAAVTAAAELVDVDGLEAAIRDGLCTALRYEHDPAPSDSFYDGTATRPVHVASGLVVPRPDLASRVVAAIDAGRPVLLVGPSGVGKSAIGWTIPAALTGILWFDVHQLETPEDANVLLRLARAHDASIEAPVGFVVDGAGTGGRTGWANLRELAAGNPGVVLLGTARNEDLAILGPLGNVSTVAVELDEDAAATIFTGLQRNGSTTVHHWREAFANSNGMTLEYTHVLTRGDRIDAVISEQIRTRLHEHRDDELDLLAVVAMADQWSATVHIGAVLADTGGSEMDLRRTIERLVAEHLLAEADGVLSGLHPVRSHAITRAIHDTPPPTLTATFRRTLDRLPTVQVARFIAQALRDHPTLSAVVMDTAPALRDPARLAQIFQGLRLADADALARGWVDVWERHAVRRALRMTLVMFTTGPIDLDMNLFPDELIRAVDAMKAVDGGTFRDELADRIGADVLAEVLATATVAEATALIATLDGWERQLQPALSAGCNLVAGLHDAPIEAITKLLATANGRADPLTGVLIDAVGGTDALLGRLHTENPWVLRAELRDTVDGPVGYARLLHVTDEQGDPRENAVALARHLLHIFPGIDATDVKVRGPGYTPVVIDGYEHGTSGLIRRYAHPETRVAWNQTLMKTALGHIGATDTDRLAAAQPPLGALVDMVAEVGARFVRSDNEPSTNLRLGREQLRLSRSGNDLPPPLGRVTAGDSSIDEPEQATLVDDLSMLITSFTDNAFRRLGQDTNLYALAAFLRDTVHGHLVATRAEPWHLIPEGTAALEHLDRLEAHLWDLHDVLKAVGDEPTAAKVILKAAHGGSWKHALRRGAQTARNLIAHAEETRRAEFETALQSDLEPLGVCVLTEFRRGLTHFAVLIELPSLLTWDEAAVVRAVRAHALDNEIVVIIPLRDGRRLDGVAVRPGRHGPAAQPDVGEWADRLDDPHPAVLGELVQSAGEALQFLSGVADLDDTRRAHRKIVAMTTAAKERFTAAIETIAAQPGDAFRYRLTAELLGLMERVDAELNGQTTDPTYASQLLAGVMGTITDEFRDAAVHYLAALEWEIDPQQVRDLLDL